MLWDTVTAIVLLVDDANVFALHSYGLWWILLTWLKFRRWKTPLRMSVKARTFTQPVYQGHGWVISTKDRRVRFAETGRGETGRTLEPGSDSSFPSKAESHVGKVRRWVLSRQSALTLPLSAEWKRGRQKKKKKEGVREDRKVMRPCDKKVTHRIGKYKYLSRFIVVFVISHIEPGQVYDYAVSL